MTRVAGVRLLAAAVTIALLAACGSSPTPEPAVPGTTSTPPAAQQEPGLPPADRARAELERRGLETTESAFLDRCFAGDDDAVALFLEAGFPANTKGPRGSALDDALSAKSAPVVKRLLAAGADPNEVVDADSATVILHRAVDSGDPELVRLLVAAGAESRPNRYRVTPLMSAALEGRLEMVKTMVDAGAKVTSRDTSGGTALSYAVLRGHVEVARLLIAAGSDVPRDREMLLKLAKDSRNGAMLALIREATAKAKPPAEKK